ncbi:hypothetical protein [Nocardioides sp. NPDC047086]|uniref:hypothetical protein n=1 Tax=Nocardioides sp. NPDC047086 TaxID=3154810 RepID=UPI0034021D86
MTEPLLDAALERRLRHELAIPYVALVDCYPQDGDWIRRAAYPELPGCTVESYSTLEVMDLLEQLRIDTIVDAVLDGRELPTERRPLSGGSSGLSDATLRTVISDAIARRTTKGHTA